MDSDPNTEEQFWAEGEKKALENQASDTALEVQKGNQVTIILLASLVVLILVGAVAFQNLDTPESNEEALDMTLIETAKAGLSLPAESVLKTMNDKHPEMVYIPGGSAIVGIFEREYAYKIANKDFSGAKAKIVEVAPFYIDRFEYPNRIEENGNPQKPYVNVSFKQATQACEVQGKRLCTAEEWEKACRGPEYNIYGYGDSYDAELCNKENYNNDCLSGYGVYGMSAGPREWTGSSVKTSLENQILKGGDRSGTPERTYRCSYESRVGRADLEVDISRGVRCCRDAQ
ncbi:MAG: SUMF1/EgtB/PvdO family nonheme iron enzyme [Myxococcota bacterium]|nr:SUMF1/EgtB/PvdO family nonheme iron enzyme [Myxococcota bacterium]